MPRVQTSGTKAAKRPPVPIPDAAALAARFKDFPAIDIIERRLADPRDPGSLPILLKGEAPGCCVNTDHQLKMRDSDTTCRLCQKPVRQWYVRWFNLQQEGRNAALRQKGYVPVEQAELQDAGDVADLFRSDRDSFVRRGDRGLELLCKMPLLLYNEIQRRRRESRVVKQRSAKARREERAEIAGAALGDEAGQTIYDGGIKEEHFRYTKSTLGAEAETDRDDDE